VPGIDPRLESALGVQLGHWRRTLVAGAERVGWKLGVGDRERIGPGPVIGHLTSATRLEAGAAFRAGGAVALHADAEIALEVGWDVDPDADAGTAREAIAGYGAALELVDLGAPSEDPEGIVAANVFHRAFALGRSSRSLPAGGVEGKLIVNGTPRAAAVATVDPVEAVRTVARLLGSLGEGVRAGDRVITGSVVQVPIAPGDDVIADLGGLGRIQLAIVS
jgi:2-keto-4-pentenoate hydratase